MRLIFLIVALAGCCAEKRVAYELPAARVDSEPYVFVLGQVERPGRYRLVAPTLLTHLIAAAGPTPLASTAPLITRTSSDGRKVRLRVSLRRIEESEVSDVWLFPGDIVYVDERTD